jgi:hypothetical protein
MSCHKRSGKAYIKHEVASSCFTGNELTTEIWCFRAGVVEDSIILECGALTLAAIHPMTQCDVAKKAE